MSKQGWVSECFLLLFVCSFVISTPQEQIDALEEFYTSTNGDNWINNSGWGVGDPCSPTRWFGIRCEGINVVAIEFPSVTGGNRVSGTLPDSLSVIPLKRL